MLLLFPKVGHYLQAMFLGIWELRSPLSRILKVLKYLQLSYLLFFCMVSWSNCFPKSAFYHPCPSSVGLPGSEYSCWSCRKSCWKGQLFWLSKRDQHSERDWNFDILRRKFLALSNYEKGFLCCEKWNPLKTAFWWTQFKLLNPQWINGIQILRKYMVWQSATTRSGI